MTILVADDEKLIRDLVKEYGQNEGYTVLEARDGNEAISMVQNKNIDLIILDIMMPNLDGYNACKTIKKHKDIPIIFLSARSEEFDKLLGFEKGADDYMTKPFSPKELFARIKTISKRFNNIDEYIIGELKIDIKGHAVYIKNEELSITPKEYELLLYFIQNKNIALSREQLLSKVWGYDYYGDDRTIDTHVKMLRNNLGQYRNLIITVRGVGYKFEIKK